MRPITSPGVIGCQHLLVTFMGSIYTMSDEAAIRRSNLNAVCVRRGWVSRKGGTTGSPSDLFSRLGRSPSFWSDRLRGARDIGPDLAREIEAALDLPKYSLDGDEESSDFVTVARLSVEVGAGPGRIPSVVEELGALQFRRDFLRGAGVSPASAAIINVKGYSMDPTIKDGAVLLINKTDRIPKAGNIYAFSWDGEMLVKRFLLLNGLWIASSDNPDKVAFADIPIDGLAETLVQGRAIWMGARL